MNNILLCHKFVSVRKIAGISNCEDKNVHLVQSQEKTHCCISLMYDQVTKHLLYLKQYHKTEQECKYKVM